MLKQNEEGKKIIKELHEVILEEKEINPDIAFQIGRFIELENRRWLLKHKNELIHNGDKEISVLDYLIACKLTELRKPFNLDDIKVFEEMTNLLKSYYNNIKEENNNELKSVLNVKYKDDIYKINCCNNLENYIVNLDPSYAKYLDEHVDWFYENYIETKNKQAKPVSKPVTEQKTTPVNNKKFDTFIDVETKKAPTPVAEQDPISSVSSWVNELGNHFISKNKQSKRK